MGAKGYFIYEAVNKRRREAVVGVSESEDLQSLKESHAKLPPVWMTRWDVSEATYRIVRGGLSIREAFEAATTHARDRSLAKLSVHVIG